MKNQFNILPLADREQNKKVQSILEKKYDSANNKKVTLNERFAVNEKGYFLHATKSYRNLGDPAIFYKIDDRNLVSKKDFIESYLAKASQTLFSSKTEEDKENVRGTVKNTNNN
ncbi:unnamed protein product [Caenorhabditis sp. 36 PRJEB53466]|nr:unnamed protein product [Caenorhabditis sp. 36 PRJEB53466]